MATKSKAPTGAVPVVAKRTAARGVVARKGATKAPAKALTTKVPVRTAARKVSAKASVKPVSPVVAEAATDPKKVKLVRDSFSFPANEHALLAEVKKRALKMGREFKKSEVLRAGIAHLAAMADHALLTALSKVERVKTGRPAKKTKKK